MALLPKSMRLKKDLGLFSVYAIATGATLSSGFFLLPGLAFSSAGPSLMLSYLIAGFVVLPALLAKAELATAMPRAGGIYYFLDRSMGPLFGTIGGIGTWLALTFKTAFALVGVGAYLHLFFPTLPMVPLALGFALLFGAVNLMDVKAAGSVQGVFVTILLVLLAVFIGKGSFEIQPSHFEGFLDVEADGLFYTAGLVFVSYLGLSKVASVSEEVKNPERNLPLAMLLALVTAMAVYAFGTTVMVGVLPADQLAGDLTPVATAARVFMGHTGVVIMTFAAVLAFSSVANAGILSASRYPLAMSRDHVVPEIFSKLNRTGSPFVSVMATVALVAVCLLVFDAVKIAKLASAFQLLLFALNCIAVIIMRESRIESYDPPGFRSPFYPWLHIFGFVAPLWLIAQMGWMPVIFTWGMALVGVGWYLKYARARVSRHGAIYHVFERLGQRRYAELDTELRGILKEKGLREQDPFDDVIARAQIQDEPADNSFETLARQAAAMLAPRVLADADHLFEGFMRGTKLGATPVSHGAALPHVRVPGSIVPELVLTRCAEGVDMTIMDEFGDEFEPEEPIRAVFFLVSSEENPGQHLRILAQIAGQVDDENFMLKWTEAKNDQEMKEIMLRDERYLSVVVHPSGPSSALIGRSLIQAEIPTGCLVAIVRRGSLSFVPHGTTRLNEGDRLTVIGDPGGIQTLRETYG